MVAAACDGYTSNYSYITGPLCLNTTFRCAQYLEDTQPIDKRTMKEVQSLRVPLSRGYALCWRWLQATGCYHTLQLFMGKVLPLSTTSNQPQSASSDVFNVHKKCDAACSRDLGNDSGYAGSSSA